MLKLSDSQTIICFGQNAKAKNIKGCNYPVFDTSVFDNFFADKDNYNLPDLGTGEIRRHNIKSIDDVVDRTIRWSSNNSHKLRSTEESIPYPELRRHGDGFILKLGPLLRAYKEPKQDGVVWSTVIQNGLDIVKVQVMECTPMEYEFIVPEHVEKSLEDHRHNFDEVVVLYPKEQVTPLIKYVDPKKIIDDPLLCGKLKSSPGIYFLIDYWVVDVNPKEFFAGSLSQMLIQKDKLFLQSETSEGEILQMS